jgi:RNA polymerase sigma-70 factor, ECF subfamily
MNTPITLLERLRTPNEPSAWGRFVDLYTPVLFAWARQLGLSDPDAADLVQEVFVLLLQKLPEFRYERGKSFRAWLKTITLNKYREDRRRRVPLSAGEGELEAVPESAEAFWEQDYRDHLTRRALEVMKAEFQPTTWKAFWELVVNGRPGTEVAGELGVSVNSVYIARSRVLRRLRQELSELTE